MIRIGMSTKQVMIVVILGVVLWYLAALLAQFLGHIGAFDGTNRVILYAAVVPASAPSVLLIWKAAGLDRSQIAIGMAVATTAAMLCDGVALAWFSTLYGANAEQIAASGAVILWGAAVGQCLAFLLNRPV